LKLRIEVTSVQGALYDWRLRVISGIENSLKSQTDVSAFRIEIDEDIPTILAWSKEVTRT
jgi:hypothetical protein